MNKNRPIHEIAEDIRKNWKNVYFGAVPYLEAMESLSVIQDYYGVESAREIVERFLANAGSFRGEEAKRIKKELKIIIGTK